MIDQSQVLNDHIMTLDQQFYLVMDRYLQTLIQYYIHDNANNHLQLEGVEGQLNGIYQKTLILASKIEKAIDINNNKSLALDEKVKIAKIEYHKVEKELAAITGSDLAANPLKKEMHHDMLRSYFYTAYYSIAIVGGVYFIYKKLRS